MAFKKKLCTQKRIQIVELFYEKQRSVKNVFRKLRDFYGLLNRPSESYGRIITKSPVRWKIKKFGRSTRSRGKIGLVRESVAEDPEISIKGRS